MKKFNSTKYFLLEEVYKDFEKFKEIKNLLDEGYIIFIVDKYPMNWGYYSLYDVKDLLWFIEWVVPKFLGRVKDL
jgi:hypothetical protein